MSAEPILKVERLTKSYPVSGGEALTVLREVSFALPAGASLAIVGPSGSGKRGSVRHRSRFSAPSLVEQAPSQC